MTGIWVDTDFGFDDLWALLLLRYLGCPVAGVSLVAGNSPLDQVTMNALSAKAAYGFNWPIWRGAARPLKRRPETAQHILGPTGMRTRGRHLPASTNDVPPDGAVEALRLWLSEADAPREILALGPLTNLARLVQEAPDSIGKIARLVWMGGSRGPGNHSAMAEFNALADPEALHIVATSGLRLDIVDLELCRRVVFNSDDMPQTDDLTADLLGGYLDIALERERDGMAIYDPLAALAVARPECIRFRPCRVDVSITDDETYGATRMSWAEESGLRWAVGATSDLKNICLDALELEKAHGT